MNALHRLLAGVALALPAMVLPAQADTPDVVVSIKPIGSLVALVMEGVGEPRVLVSGNASPHAYTMRPSDAQAVEKADLVFWMGPGFEAFLAKPLETLGKNAEAVALSQTPNVIALPFRTGGAFEAHDHSHEGHAHGEEDHDAHEAGHEHADDHDHDHGHSHEAESGEHEHAEGGTDLHMWLDPANARIFVGTIAAHLSEADPENAATYRANADKTVARLDAEEKRIASELAPVKDVPFVVFHDAYQYFDKRFGLNTVGSITVSPETAPGAKRLSEIKARIADLKAACVFSEPNFEPRVVETVIEGTQARTGVLDPEGTAIEAGPELYFTLMDGIADSLKTCLSQGS